MTKRNSFNDAADLDRQEKIARLPARDLARLRKIERDMERAVEKCKQQLDARRFEDMKRALMAEWLDSNTKVLTPPNMPPPPHKREHLQHRAAQRVARDHRRELDRVIRPYRDRMEVLHRKADERRTPRGSFRDAAGEELGNKFKRKAQPKLKLFGKSRADELAELRTGAEKLPDALRRDARLLKEAADAKRARIVEEHAASRDNRFAIVRQGLEISLSINRTKRVPSGRTKPLTPDRLDKLAHDRVRSEQNKQLARVDQWERDGLRKLTGRDDAPVKDAPRPKPRAKGREFERE